VTRAEAEALVVGACARWLVDSGVSADPAGDASPREYLTFPLIEALGLVGVSVAAPPTVTDDDMAGVSPALFTPFMATFEATTLQLCVNGMGRSLAVRSRTIGDLSITTSDLKQSLQNLVDARWSQLRILYGIGVATLHTGRVRLFPGRHRGSR
jgi:hypothetical protein